MQNQAYYIETFYLYSLDLYRLYLPAIQLLTINQW